MARSFGLTRQGIRVVEVLVDGFRAFFAARGEPVPWLTAIGTVPAPFDLLLDHGRTMTVTLAAAWRSTVGRRTLDEEMRDGRMSRTVVLVAADTPVEFAHLRIDRTALPDGLEDAADAEPFGGWLARAGIETRVKVQQLLRVDPTPGLCRLLGTRPDEVSALYGRITALSGAGTRVFARSLEILSPAIPPALDALRGPVERPVPAGSSRQV